MNASARRKRGACVIEPPRTRTTPKTSRTASRTGSRKTSRGVRARPTNQDEPAAAAAAPETIDVMDGEEEEEEQQEEEEVVDLTRESADASVVDLTSSDSVLLVDEAGPRSRRPQAGDSYVVSSDDDEDTPPVVRATSHTSKSQQGTISCPICMDMYSEILDSGRLVVSTRCGHVFCSQCLRNALKSSLTCPTCRMKLNHRQYHPLYI